MCGIAGEIAIARGGATDLDRALPMLRAILHRGPDGVGGWSDTDGRFTGLHARLALVDVPSGSQPMLSVEGDVVIVFNGEIYGFARLRRELEARGARFRTRSDTEVLIQLYRLEGPAFLSRIEGEFAFALFDRRKGTVLLARDPYGVKPLFVSRQRNLLLFASEVKGILAHSFTERRLNAEAVDRRLKGVFLPQETLFEGVEAVEPGTAWTISRDGISVHRYHDTDPAVCGTSTMSMDEAVEAFDEAMGAATATRLHGDEPVGLYLSGGADSATVAAHAVANATTPPKAFTIDFVGDPWSEIEAARATASQLGIDLCAVPVDPESHRNAFAESIWHTESFVHNMHGTAKWVLARRARQEVKAVLTGEGADEFHAGYAYYRHAELLARPDSGAELAHFLTQNGPYQSVAPRATRLTRSKLAWSVHGGAPYAALRASALDDRLRPLLSRSFRAERKVAPAEALLAWLDQRSPTARQLNDVSLSQLTAILTDLPVYNLAYLADRVEMAAGLEGRLPFLDKRVTDLLWRLPLSHHLSADGDKLVERRALAARVTAASQRTKQMFMTPISPALAVLTGEAGREWLSPATIRSAGVFNPQVLGWLHRLVRMLPARSRISTQATGVLTAAASLHVVKSMFIDHFDQALDARAAMTVAQLRRAIDQPVALSA